MVRQCASALRRFHMVDRDQLRTPSHSVTQPNFRALACTCIVCWAPWCFMVAELCSRPYTHVLPGMFLLHGTRAVLRHHNNQGITVCNLLGSCDGTGAGSRPESRTQAHDSLIVGETIHSDMRPRTRNQGISVCNLLGNCDGTGAGPRSESRTQKHTTP